MFIETLEFTIPIELCNVFSTLQKGPRSNLEFPASVNSYGTTQDANVQVVLRSNKVTFKVDGVSSNASMISKSECKTLKLSVFDVDRSLMPREEDDYNSNSIDASPMQQSESITIPMKRHHDHEQSSYTPAKSSRISFPDSPKPRSPPHRRSQPHASPRPTENSLPKSRNDSHINVKQEPEDPDLIEIEPDPEIDDIVPKREKDTPFMQIDYSSSIPHTQTSQAALDRLSFNQQSAQSPASSSSFHQNVPHVPEYAEAGPSRVHHGDQSADDFLVFQDDNEGDDNEADYSNDGNGSCANMSHQSPYNIKYPRHDPRFHAALDPLPILTDVFRGMLPSHTDLMLARPVPQTRKKPWPCVKCDKVFSDSGALVYHREAIHEHKVFRCACGKVYTYRTGLISHKRTCQFSNN